VKTDGYPNVGGSDGALDVKSFTQKYTPSLNPVGLNPGANGVTPDADAE
jgi:hypothetical protein